MKSRLEVFEELAPIARRIASAQMRRLPTHECDDELVHVALMGVWEVVTRHYGKDENELEAQAVVRARGAVLDLLRTRDWATRTTRKKGRPYLMLPIDSPREDVSQRIHEKLRCDVTPEDEAADNEVADRRAAALKEALSKLPKREQYIVQRLLYGISATALAKELGISQPRITQIMSRVLPLLKKYTAEHLRGYVKNSV